MIYLFCEVRQNSSINKTIHLNLLLMEVDLSKIAIAYLKFDKSHKALYQT